MNVSIIGSCLSRDMFNSKFIANYKDYCRVYSYYPRTTMLSVMSGPISYRHAKLMKSDIKRTEIEHWFQEAEKTVLKSLETNKPDVLLMDFYGDVRYGAVAFRGEYILRHVKKMTKYGIIKENELGIVYNYKKNTQDYILMWKNSFDRFMDFMQKNLPETEIIINTAKGTNVVTDENGATYISPKAMRLDIDRMNALWRIFDEYAIEKYHLKSINFEKEYTLNPNYLYGGLGDAICHFHMDYYEDCFKKFLELTANIPGVKKVESTRNMIIDSAFENGLRNWTNMKGDYEVIPYEEYSAVSPIDCREQLGEYKPQLWSKPMEIIGDGVNEYTLSFNVKFPDAHVYSEDTVLFVGRSFKYLHEVKFSDALGKFKLTLGDGKLQENGEYRFVYTFKPIGNYQRVAPYMTEFIPGVEYSRIKLEHAGSASEYTK